MPNTHTYMLDPGAADLDWHINVTAHNYNIFDDISNINLHKTKNSFSMLEM